MLNWIIGIALAVTAAATVAVAMRWQVQRAIRDYRVALPYASRSQVITEDGATIELRRLPGSGEGVPVLLVHGLAANHRNVDFHPDNSLARHLAAEGRDVWLITLRSGLRGRSLAQTRAVTFEAMVRNDLPRGIATVLERTGAEHLDYVGFSMGGMLLYAALGRAVPTEHIRKVVIIGSPGVIESPFFGSLLRYLRVPWLPTLYLDAGATLAAVAAEWAQTPFHHLFYNPAMAKPGWTKSALVDIIVDVPGRLSADFAGWATGDGQIRLSDGSEALKGLESVRTPARFFAGAGDILAPPSSVEVAFRAWAANHADVDKHMSVLGVEQGAAGDYRHGDLAMGDGLQADLYEPISAFLTS